MGLTRTNGIIIVLKTNLKINMKSTITIIQSIQSHTSIQNFRNQSNYNCLVAFKKGRKSTESITTMNIRADILKNAKNLVLAPIKTQFQINPTINWRKKKNNNNNNSNIHLINNRNLNNINNSRLIISQIIFLPEINKINNSSNKANKWILIQMDISSNIRI